MTSKIMIVIMLLVCLYSKYTVKRQIIMNRVLVLLHSNKVSEVKIGLVK